MRLGLSRYEIGRDAAGHPGSPCIASDRGLSNAVLFVTTKRIYACSTAHVRVGSLPALSQRQL